MRPVDMLVMHDPSAGRFGDCFRCCIASLLDKAPEDVPHFCEKGPTDGGAWFERLNEWLAGFGLTYFDINIGRDTDPATWFSGIQSSGVSMYHVLSGDSPRFPGTGHSVVARNGVIAHDPHPDRTGLAGPGEEGWLIGLVIRRCGA